MLEKEILAKKLELNYCTFRIYHCYRKFLTIKNKSFIFTAFDVINNEILTKNSNKNQQSN